MVIEHTDARVVVRSPLSRLWPAWAMLALAVAFGAISGLRIGTYRELSCRGPRCELRLGLGRETSGFERSWLRTARLDTRSGVDNHGQRYAFFALVLSTPSGDFDLVEGGVARQTIASEVERLHVAAGGSQPLQLRSDRRLHGVLLFLLVVSAPVFVLAVLWLAGLFSRLSFDRATRSARVRTWRTRRVACTRPVRVAVEPTTVGRRGEERAYRVTIAAGKSLLFTGLVLRETDAAEARERLTRLFAGRAVPARRDPVRRTG